MAGSSSAADVGGVEQSVHTGALPGWDQVEADVVDAYERYRSRTSGVVADYIPALAAADPELFGISVAEVGGAVHVAA
ncbi:glutaminase [Rhodococcus qingshengii]|uniref:glutaminase n=1 Tax=Rhodococcus qingshengii TaxID=334542 RepID=UPI00237CFB7F|nr:glutaminase [Rhodococcus qingshengii]WCT06070.1 glutaminase [Rhodococcus qingshengii]